MEGMHSLYSLPKFITARDDACGERIEFATFDDMLELSL